MGFFKDSAEVHHYVGGIFRIAAGEPALASSLETADTQLRILCADPVCELNVSLSHPMTIGLGRSDLVPEVTLLLDADVLDGFFRGHYSILDGLARGDIRARGPVSRILKILPFAESLVPQYCDLVAEKDAESRVAEMRSSSTPARYSVSSSRAEEDSR